MTNPLNIFYKNKNETFEDIININQEINSKNFNNLIEYVKTKKIYISLLFMDFTYLNKEHTYETGNKLKNKLLNFIESNRESYNIIYYSITSSKVYIYTKKEISSSNFRIEIGNQIKNFIQEYNYTNNKKINNENKKLVFIVDKDDLTNQTFSVGPYDSNLIELFNKTINIEKYLSQYRKQMQQYFNNYNKINSTKNMESINKIHEFELTILHSKFTINKYKNLNIDKLENIKNWNTIYQCIKNSTYLKNACEYWKLWHKSQKDDFHKEKIKENIIKYLIWEETQLLQFIGFKIEKIKPYLNRKSENNPDNPDNVIMINQYTKQEDDNISPSLPNEFYLMNWFESTLTTFHNITLTQKQNNEITDIRYQINNFDFKFKNTKILRDKIQHFFDNLKIKGMFNIPLEKIKPNITSINFFKDLLYSNFGINYKNTLEQWLQQPYIKDGYFLFINIPKDIYKGINFINYNLFNMYNQKLYHLHMSFLEIDYFNAFNTYYFPNDSDDIIYKKIIDSIFKVANEFLYKSKDLYITTKIKEKSIFAPILNSTKNNKTQHNIFTSFTCAAMGDEFFFAFLTPQKISKKEKKFIDEFLKAIKEEILEVSKNISFPKTKKVNIETKKGVVTFRQIMYDTKLSFKKNILLDIGHIGVSGVRCFDIPYNPTSNNLENIFKHYENKFDKMGMVAVKENKKGEIIEFTANDLELFNYKKE